MAAALKNDLFLRALKRQRRADGICLHALLARDEK